MSLWLYKCNNFNANPDGFTGEWGYFFDRVKRSKSGSFGWGGPEVTGQPVGRRLAESIAPGQRMLCWQRWGRPSKSYPPPKGATAAAIGIVEFDRFKRGGPGDRWLLRPVEQFNDPVPLLSWRASNAIIDAVFRNPRQMGTFTELSSTEEREVLRLCSRYLGTNPGWATASRAASAPNANKVGAGFGDPVKNKQVELAAIRRVTKALKKDGWSVASREADKVGYDLDAKKGRRRRHVEVKGVHGGAPAFIVTTNEVRAAQTDPAWEVWVVTNALGKKPIDTVISGADLELTYELQPIAFRATPGT